MESLQVSDNFPDSESRNKHFLFFSTSLVLAFCRARFFRIKRCSLSEKNYYSRLAFSGMSTAHLLRGDF